jgi:NAD(P)-dependent dehydrogenase (short-subunit alcohol dehydrogenase family)
MSIKNSVLITGASTGIGFAIATDLAQHGHEVFAGVRKEADGENLRKANSSIQPIIIDVAKSETIESALASIEKLRTKDLPFCLVNNAGVALPGPIEAVPMDSFRKLYDVNVFGLLETTQIFLPIIRETKGRIVNMSSIGGLVSTPFLGAYNSSKFAVEALSDALRRELASFGVKVVAIEPGTIQTPIWEKGLNDSATNRAKMKPASVAPYEKNLDRFERQVGRIAETGIPASRVADAVRRALTSSSPKAREIVLSNGQRMQLTFARRMPTQLVDKVFQRFFFRR